MPPEEKDGQEPSRIFFGKTPSVPHFSEKVGDTSLTREDRGGSELRPIRTYQSDVEETLRSQNVSRTTIALAESNRKRKESEALLGKTLPVAKVFTISQTIPLGSAPRHSALNWHFIALALGALLLIAAASFAWRYIGTKLSEPGGIATPPAAAQKGSTDVVLQGGESRDAFLKTVREKAAVVSVPLNELRLLSIRIEERPVTTEELFAFLESGASASFIRSLDAVPTVALHGSRGSQLFLLFKVLSFDHAFDGMLAWEKTLFDDMGPLLGVNPKTLFPAEASTTAEAVVRPIFKDVIIRNKDARVVFDKTGRIVFLYSFLDKETLLIVTNEETLKVVLQKASRGRLR